MNYLLPKDTRAVVTEDVVARCGNPSMILHRLIPQDHIINSTGRGEWLRNGLRRFTLDPDSKDPISTDFRNSVDCAVKRWKARTNGSKRFKRQLESRMVVGLGGKGPLEVGITLDHLTGIPYIPGSALKGLARNYALYAIAEVLKFALTGDGERDSKIFESLDDGLIAGNYDNRNEMIPLYRLAFGSQDMGGKAIFHDAVLEQTSNPNQWVFDVDVMTPHYPGYYRDSGATPPSDDQSPVPISFITVAAGCVFRFAVGWRGPKNLEAREFAADLLADALSEFGIGAKTAAGYGVFKKPS